MVNVFFRGYGQWYFVSYPDDPTGNFKLPLNDFACGVFKLSEKDEITYRYTKSIESVTYLLPCTTHPDSEFLRIMDDYLTLEDAENCFFDIDRSKDVILTIVEPCAEAKTQKNDISETERQTMLKLIIGMAIDAYGYDPTCSRSPLTGGKNTGLSAKLALKDIYITDDTIRKYLNEAKDLLYPEDQ